MVNDLPLDDGLTFSYGDPRSESVLGTRGKGWLMLSASLSAILWCRYFRNSKKKVKAIHIKIYLQK